MPEINETALFPVTQPFYELLSVVEVVLGGVFGVAILAIVMRYFFMRHITHLFADIKKDLDRIERKVERLSRKK